MFQISRAVLRLAEIWEKPPGEVSITSRDSYLGCQKTLQVFLPVVFFYFSKNFCLFVQVYALSIDIDVNNKEKYVIIFMA